MRRLPMRSLAPSAALLFGACAIAFLLVLPLRTGQVGYDSAASVLYFDRIASGQRLEHFVGATPKPLLTLVYGAIHAATDDWRPISWLAIALFGASVVMAAELARRLAGPTAAGFAALGFMGSAVLLKDVALAYTVVWMACACLAAGLALVRPHPSYPVAGIALLLGSMVRLETLIVVAVGLVAIAIQAALAWRRGLPPPSRDRWLLAIGLLSLPIQAIHDLLLTGDPLWSASIPIAGSVGVSLLSPTSLVVATAQRYLAVGPLVALAPLGLLLLWRARRWEILLGLLALGPGVLAFLMLLSIRGVYISTRYFAPVDLALLFTAAVGIEALRVPILAAIARARLRRDLLPAALFVAGGTVAVLLTSPWGPLDRDVRSTIRQDLMFHLNADRALPVLSAAVDADPSIRGGPRGTDAHAGAPPVREPALLVPILLGPQLAVDLGLGLDSIAGTVGPDLRTDGSYPRPGQIVYHDPRGDTPAEDFELLQVERPTVEGALRLDPLLADPRRRMWVVRVGAADDAQGG